MRFESFEVAMKVQSKREVTGESLNAFVAKSGLKTYHKETRRDTDFGKMPRALHALLR